MALARALAVQPQLLLLDEPFAALDAPLRGALRQELAQVQARWGITTLLVTHDLADAFALGQRVIVSDGGRVIQQGTRDAVFFRPLTRRVAEFVGTGNILPAVVEQMTAGTLWLQWQGRRIAAVPAQFVPGTPVYLCIRPTQILIVRPDRLAERERENLLCGDIVGTLMQAETYTLHLRLDESDTAYDLEVALPGYVYHRLSLESQRRIMVELRRQAEVIEKQKRELEEQFSVRAESFDELRTGSVEARERLFQQPPEIVWVPPLLAGPDEVRITKSTSLKRG